MNKEPFCVSRLQGVDPKCGPTCVLCHIQLHTCAFFVDMLNADTSAEAVAPPVPQFQAHLRGMMVDDVSWPSMLPQHYYSIAIPKVFDPKTKTKIDDPNGKKKSAQVHNLNVSSCFEEFKNGVASNKFKNIIKKVGAPLMVKSDGKDVPTCISYHLQGTCFEGCNHKRQR